MSAELIQKAINEQLIEQETHGPLLRDLDRVVRDANIPPNMLFTSMTEFCGQEEIDYVKGLRRHSTTGVCGLAYIGKKPKVAVLDRMMVTAGACLRNYVSARVMVLQEVIHALKHDAMPSPTVLLIPNFYMGKNDGGAIPDWQVTNLLGLLYSRQAENLQTILYIQDLVGLEADYGSAFRKQVETHYVRISV